MTDSLKVFAVKEVFEQLNKQKREILIKEFQDINQRNIQLEHEQNKEHIYKIIDADPAIQEKSLQYKLGLLKALETFQTYGYPNKIITEEIRDDIRNTINTMWRIIPFSGARFVHVWTQHDIYKIDHSECHDPFKCLVSVNQELYQKLFTKSYFDYEREYSNIKTI
jgi:hypothetical protein